MRGDISMSEKKPDPATQLQQQVQANINEFQTNLQIALKPFADLQKTFISTVQSMNLLLAEKEKEIQMLKSQVLKAANQDVPPAPTAKQ